jgi:hypothetical protein
VREEQVEPALAHDPWSARQRERAMIHALERRALAADRGDRFDGWQCTA